MAGNVAVYRCNKLVRRELPTMPNANNQQANLKIPARPK
jgi:hypothetical protein